MSKRFITILLVLIINVLWCKAQLPLNQKAYVDSLTTRLKQNISDSTKARINFLLSHYYINNHDDKQSGFHLDRGRKIGKKYPYLQAISYFYESDLYLDEDTVKSRQAALKGNELLSHYKTKEAYLFRAKMWYNTAILAQKNDNIKSVVDIILNKVIPLVKNGGDTLMLAKYYSQVAVVFMNSNQYHKAEIYYNLAIQTAENISSKSTIIVSTYIYAASNYIFLVKLTKAKMMLDKAKAILQLYPQSSKWPDYYYSEGNYFEQSHQYESALSSYNRGISIGHTLQQNYLVQTLLLQKYSVLTKLHNYRGATRLLDSLSREKEFMAIANNRISIYKELAKNNLRLGNVKKAYHWLDLHGQLSDSLNESRLTSEINILEGKFRNAENKKRISDLTAANDKVKFEAKNTHLVNLLLASISLLLTFTVVAGYLFYRNDKRSKALHYQQELKNIHQSHQIKLTRAMLQGQDEERKRVARDLHDGLGGMLSVVKINLSGFAANTSSIQGNNLDPVINLLDESITELRSIARNMMPASLLRLGLEVSLKDLCESMMSESFIIDFQYLAVSDTIPLDEQMTIYRIIQELLNNVVKHADAKNVLLQCSQHKDNFMITIEDDGKGFNPGCIHEKNGLGINNIKTRVAYLNGNLEIQSSEHIRGTTIHIELLVNDDSHII
jgi:two-component system NarL family sensor kinase